MPSILTESAKIIAHNELPAAYLLMGGVIKRIITVKPPTRDETIHAGRLIALPRIIDADVHLRDMQLEYKETSQTYKRQLQAAIQL